MRFIRAFLTFLRFYSFRKEDAWLLIDQKALEAFLNSPTGQKLLIRLRNRAKYADESALNSGNPFYCGISVGYRHFLAYWETLSQKNESAAQPEESQPSNKPEPSPEEQAWHSKYAP